MAACVVILRMKRCWQNWMMAVWVVASPAAALGADEDFGAGLEGVAMGHGQIVAVGARTVAVASCPESLWTIRRTKEEFHAIAFGNNTFAAVGKGGLIRTSCDGFSWSGRDSGTPRTLLSIVHGGSRFVTVGAHGAISTSSDGRIWKPAKSGTAATLAAVTWGNGVFAAVGDRGTIVISTDGLRWRQMRSPSSTYYYAVTFGNGRFVAAGDTIVTSRDGVTWKQHPTMVAGGFTSLSYGRGQFVAAAARGLFTSADGISWTARLSAKGVLESSTADENGFVAVGWHRGSCLAISSEDGMAWNSATLEEIRQQAKR